MLGLLLAVELPEAWIPPAQILELRSRVRLRKTLIDQRTAWLQWLQAQLFHQGVPPGLKPRTAAGRDALATVELAAAGREALELYLRMLDQLDHELAPIDRTLQAFARLQPGCRALTGRPLPRGRQTNRPQGSPEARTQSTVSQVCNQSA